MLLYSEDWIALYYYNCARPHRRETFREMRVSAELTYILAFDEQIFARLLDL